MDWLVNLIAVIVALASVPAWFTIWTRLPVSPVTTVALLVPVHVKAPSLAV